MCVYICVCVYIYVYIHTFAHTHTHAHTQTHKHIHTGVVVLVRVLAALYYGFTTVLLRLYYFITQVAGYVSGYSPLFPTGAARCSTPPFCSILVPLIVSI